MRTSDSKCAKKHTRRLQFVPSVQICGRTESSSLNCVSIRHHDGTGMGGGDAKPVCDIAMGDTSTRRRHVQTGKRHRVGNSHSAGQARTADYQISGSMQLLAMTSAMCSTDDSYRIPISPCGNRGMRFRCTETCEDRVSWLSPLRATKNFAEQFNRCAKGQCATSSRYSSTNLGARTDTESCKMKKRSFSVHASM